MSHKFNILKVKDVRRETPEAISVAFDLPTELSERYRFAPGKYLTLRRLINGQEIRRCYSISSGLDDGELRVAIKKVAGGVFSSFACDELRPGMHLEVMTPMGGFTAPIEPNKAKNYLALAAGSGITPIMSVLRTVLTREPLSSFTLFYGNRRTNSIIFREELDDLKDSYLGRLSVFHTLSREATDVPLYSGRLDAEKLRTFAHLLFNTTEIDHAFICGPGDMIFGLRNVLIELGMATERIDEEVFVSAQGSAPKTVPSVANSVPMEVVEVTAILDGTARRFAMSANASVLDAAREHGIELPYSCRGGMCSTCRAKVIEGTAEMKVNYSLEPWELEAGYILTCQARPTASTLTIDYDHV